MTNRHASRPEPAGVVRELASATASLTVDHDVIGMTTSLLIGCTRAVGATAAGVVLARPDDRRLELLASTSHRARELELYQLQVDEGPCVDAFLTGEAITVTGIAEVGDRWPSLQRAFLESGFSSVHAAPLLWHGDPLGALNLFFTDGHDADGIVTFAQAFADIATITVVHAGRLSPQDVVAQARAALDERVVVERAKGVLAYAEQLPLDEAFDQLLRLTLERGLPLGQVAAQIIDNAGNGKPL